MLYSRCYFARRRGQGLVPRPRNMAGSSSLAERREMRVSASLGRRRQPRPGILRTPVAGQRDPGQRVAALHHEQLHIGLLEEDTKVLKHLPPCSLLEKAPQDLRIVPAYERLSRRAIRSHFPRDVLAKELRRAVAERADVLDPSINERGGARGHEVQHND